MFKDSIRENRTCRRFDEGDRVSAAALEDWVDNARMTASSANRQPLKYALVTDEAACAQLFAVCTWAAALPDWDGPAEGERPSGYIVMLVDTHLSMNDVFTARDEGIAAQTIMLSARDAGYAACIIGAFKKKECATVLGIDADAFDPALIIAVGRPVEQVQLADMPQSGSTVYWRTPDQVHHVPKRSLDEVIVARA